MGLFGHKSKENQKLQYPIGGKRTRPSPGRRTTETSVNAPLPGYHGPHFHRGPAQEDIWNQRQQNIQISYEDIRGRSHTFHSPIEQHQYSNPYELRPGPFTKRMEQEYADYKKKAETCGTNRSAVKQAKNVPVGRNYVPETIHGRQIMTAVDLAIEGRIQANAAAQARAGFQQKYPQAYKDNAIVSHWIEASNARKAASAYREAEVSLRKLHGRWEQRMVQYEQQQVHRGSPSGC
ncbi:uncharacterized protein N7458_010731 [Penicillium daleae]|uniref:Uncharacterized protein n=1 Tax=Penicillium daleae TaxID=63821 RepID=A0AAD6C0S1_9EURO|nr:uncharacterized protein N7458_010731 [Penicillium daleae]KAJ5439733.1 hypothetical protein N7458_010731 [Penicillium daleae]